MSAEAEVLAFEKAVDPFLKLVLPGRVEELLQMSPGPGLQERLEELSGKSREGTLSDEETAEYEGYVRANKFIAMLRRQAKRIGK